MKQNKPVEQKKSLSYLSFFFNFSIYRFNFHKNNVLRECSSEKFKCLLFFPFLFAHANNNPQCNPFSFRAIIAFFCKLTRACAALTRFIAHTLPSVMVFIPSSNHHYHLHHAYATPANSWKEH